MFLFDKHKSSRQLFSSGSQIISVRWKRYLNSYPPYCAESTAAIDSDGNFYFGTHSGAFYSLNKNVFHFRFHPAVYNHWDRRI